MSSRQQRREEARRLKKLRAIENAHLKSIEMRQEMIDDKTFEMFVTCIGLAVCDVYPDQRHRPNIMKIASAWNFNALRVKEGGVTLYDLQRELKDRTATKTKEGIEFSWKEGDYLSI